MLEGSLWKDVYNAQYNQNALSFIKFGLITGEPYTFRVFAVDFNGKSDPSSSLTVYACGIPSTFEAPTFVVSD